MNLLITAKSMMRFNMLKYFLSAGFLILFISCSSESLSQQEQVQKKGDRSLSFTDEENGEDVFYEVNFKNGEIVSIYRNNIKITDDELDDYSDKVYDVLGDIQEEKHKSYVFDFDMNELNENLKKMQENFKAEQFKFKFDNEEFKKQMEKLKEELKDMDEIVIKIDKDKIKESLDKLKIHSFDYDYDFNFDSELNPEELQEEMNELNEEIDELSKEMEKLDKEMKSLNNFLNEAKSELIKDGYIKEDESMRLELSDKEMIINDEKVPSTVHKKYLNIYKKHYNELPESKIKFHLE